MRWYPRRARESLARCWGFVLGFVSGTLNNSADGPVLVTPDGSTPRPDVWAWSSRVVECLCAAIVRVSVITSTRCF
eukprot:651140-Lingulodinium_polyedra.AAC.1